MVPSIDGGWGSIEPDGSWNGMVGMVHRNEVDIAVSDFFITSERQAAVDSTATMGSVPYVRAIAKKTESPFS